MEKIGCAQNYSTAMKGIPKFCKIDLCGVRNYMYQLNAAPEGQVLAEVKGVIVRYTTSLIVNIDDESLNFAIFPEMFNPKFTSQRWRISVAPLKTPIRFRLLVIYLT